MAYADFTAGLPIQCRVYDYDFYKKVNSTKRPYEPNNTIDQSHATAIFSSMFTQPFDIINPTLTIQLGNTCGDKSYTADGTSTGNSSAVIAPRYIKVSTATTPSGLDFRKDLYYFVDSVETLANGTVICQCSLDVLATFRDEIKQCHAFVERSATGYNGNISDSQIIPTNAIAGITPSEATLLPDFNAGNTDLIIRTVGKSGLNNYVLSPANLKAVLEQSFDLTVGAPDDFSGLSWTAVEDAVRSLATVLINPAQFIQSVKWFPCDLRSSTSEYVSFGYVLSTSQYNLAKDSYHGTVAVAKPPKQYNDWRDKDKRFTKLVLYLPCIGLVDVDPLYYDSNIVVEYGIDTNTGACAVLLTAGGAPIGWYSGTAGIDIPVGGVNAGQALTALGGASLSGLTGNLGGVVSGLAQARENILSPTQTVFGASGNRAVWDIAPNIIMYRVSMGSSGSPRQALGSPTLQYTQLGTLSGYVKCANGTFEESLLTDVSPLAPNTTMLKNIKDMINQYLVSGFYIENDDEWQFDRQTKVR